LTNRSDERGYIDARRVAEQRGQHCAAHRAEVVGAAGVFTVDDDLAVPFAPREGLRVANFPERFAIRGQRTLRVSPSLS